MNATVDSGADVIISDVIPRRNSEKLLYAIWQKLHKPQMKGRNIPNDNIKKKLFFIGAPDLD